MPTIPSNLPSAQPKRTYVIQRTPEELFEKLEKGINASIEYFGKAHSYSSQVIGDLVFEAFPSTRGAFNGNSEYSLAQMEFYKVLFHEFQKVGFDKNCPATELINILRKVYLDNPGHELIERMNASNPNRDPAFAKLIEDTPQELREELALRTIEEGEGSLVFNHIIDFGDIDYVKVARALVYAGYSYACEVVRDIDLFPGVKADKEIAQKLIDDGKAWVFNYEFEKFTDLDYPILVQIADSTKLGEKGASKYRIKEDIDRFNLTPEQKADVLSRLK